jgi:hypothetical protein
VADGKEVVAHELQGKPSMQSSKPMTKARGILARETEMLTGGVQSYGIAAGTSRGTTPS